MGYNPKDLDEDYEDELINEFGDKDELDSVSDLDSNLRDKDEKLGMQSKEEDYIFDKKNAKKSKKKKKDIENKLTNKLLIIGFIIVLLCIIVDGVLIGYKVFHVEEVDVKPLLMYKDKAVIYDNNNMEKQVNDRVPIINMNNSSINSINNDVIKIYNIYYKNNPDYFRYDYSVNNDSISLVIIYRNKLDDEYHYSYKFKTYNINLKTLTLMGNEYILDKYNLNLSDVNKKMKNEFNKTYLELLRKNYIDESYSFDRLIVDLDLTNITKDINFYIDDNKLYVYRSYDIYGNDKVTSYFNESNYKFYIK